MNKKDWWEDEEFDLNLTEEVLAASQHFLPKKSEKLTSKSTLKLKSASFSENTYDNNVDNDLMQKYYILQGENKTLTESLNNLRQEIKNIQLQEKLKQEENKYHLKFIQQKTEQELEKIKSEILFKDKEIIDLKNSYNPKIAASQKISYKIKCQNTINHDTENVAIQTEYYDMPFHNNKNISELCKIFQTFYVICDNLMARKILSIENMPEISSFLEMTAILNDSIKNKSLEATKINSIVITGNLIAIATLIEFFFDIYLKVLFKKLREDMEDSSIKNSPLNGKFIIWDIWFKSIIVKYIEIEDFLIKDGQPKDIKSLYDEIATILPNLFDLLIKVISYSTEMPQYININIFYSQSISFDMETLKSELYDENSKKIAIYIKNYVNMNKSKKFINKLIASITLTSKIPESLHQCKKSILNQLIDLFIQLSGSNVQKNPTPLPEFQIPTPILKSLLYAVAVDKGNNLSNLIQLLDLFISFINIGFDFSKSTCKPKKAAITTTKKREVSQCVLHSVIQTVMSAITGAGQNNLSNKECLILITKLTDFLYVMAAEGQLKVILERNSCDCPSKFFEFLTHTLEYLSNFDAKTCDRNRISWPLIKMTAVTAIQILHTLSRTGKNPLQQIYCPFHQSSHLLVLLYESLSTFFNVKDEDSLHQDMILDLIQPMMSEEEINQLLDDQNMDLKL